MSASDQAPETRSPQEERRAEGVLPLQHASSRLRQIEVSVVSMKAASAELRETVSGLGQTVTGHLEHGAGIGDAVEQYAREVRDSSSEIDRLLKQGLELVRIGMKHATSSELAQPVSERDMAERLRKDATVPRASWFTALLKLRLTRGSTYAIGGAAVLGLTVLLTTLPLSPGTADLAYSILLIMAAVIGWGGLLAAFRKR